MVLESGKRCRRESQEWLIVLKDANYKRYVQAESLPGCFTIYSIAALQPTVAVRGTFGLLHLALVDRVCSLVQHSLPEQAAQQQVSERTTREVWFEEDEILTLELRDSSVRLASWPSDHRHVCHHRTASA